LVKLGDGKYTVLAMDDSRIMGVVVEGKGSGNGEAQFVIPQNLLGRAVRFRANNIKVKEDGKIVVGGQIRVDQETFVPVTLASKYLLEVDQHLLQLEDLIREFKEKARYKYTILAGKFNKAVKELSANKISSAVYFVSVSGQLVIFEEGTTEVLVAPLTSAFNDEGIIGKYATDYVKIIGDISQKIRANTVKLWLDKDTPLIVELETISHKVHIAVAPQIEERDTDDLLELVRALV